MQSAIVDLKKYFPISAITFGGKIKIAFVKFIFSLLHVFVKRKWNDPVFNFDENPIHFKLKDVIYLGYKYYCNPHQNGKERFKPNPLKNYNQSTNGYQTPNGITLHVGGDLMPYEMLLNGNANELWQLAGKDFFAADIVMANLECPMDFKQKKGFVPEVMLNDMLFNGSEELMDVFTARNKYKYDVLTLANNHMLDAGNDGLIATMEMLDQQGVRHLGARRNLKEENHLIVEKNGIKLGIVNYTYSLNRVIPEKGKENLVNYLELNVPSIDISPIIDASSKARNAGAEVLIGSFHMGNAYQCYPSEHIQKQVHRLFSECGFDLLFISHPHNLQPAEIVPFTCKITGAPKEGIVYYSLGDFVAYDIFNWSHLTGYAKVNIAKTPTGIELKPSFEFLYLQREKSGKLCFVPWDLAIQNVSYHNDKFYYLNDWYQQHAKYFF